MDQTNLEKRNPLKCKYPIIILAFLSLVCSALKYVRSFETLFNDFISPDYFFRYSFRLFFELTITLAPSVLLLIYVLKFHSRSKATVLMPITFGIIAATPLFFSIDTFIRQWRNNYDDISWYLSSITDTSAIYGLAIIVLFALLTFDALKGLSRRIILISAVAIGLLTELFSFIYFLDGSDKFIQYSFSSKFVGFIGIITLYSALLLFGLTNKIPVIISKKKKNIEKLTPEQALKTLKKEFELGMITEEEYQAQRAKIINKL